MSTFIGFILDRSGSMEKIRGDVIGGTNVYLKEQREEPGEVTFMLVQFDDQYEVVHDCVSLRDVPDLNETTFVPRGSTALRDAIGRTINAMDARIQKLDPKDRPRTVIVTIMTDGLENFSKEFSASDIRTMIKEKEELGWKFAYLGANQDAFREAGSLGFSRGSTTNFDCTSADVSATYSKISNLHKRYRTGVGEQGFTKEEQK